MSNLVDREYIVNNTGLTGGAGLSRKLAYTRLYLLNTYRKNLFCLEDSSYVLYGDAIRDSLELEARYEVKIPIMVWEECCWGESGCISVNGSWGKFVFGGYMVFHYPDIPLGSHNGFGHNDDFTGGGDIWGPQTGSGGDGGSDPFGSLGFYVKKQLKSHLLKLKTLYGFSQRIEQLLPMVYSCYTIDPDFDEVTFDDDCAIVGIASRYLNAIQYSGNYAVATGWLSGHIPDLVALMDHVEEHIQEEEIRSYHGVMMDLLDNNEGYVRERFFELWDLLRNDPDALLRPCVEQNSSYPYSFWSDQYNFTPDQFDLNAMNNRGFFYQALSSGNAAKTSVDYYYIEITQMPDFNNDGQPDSEQQVINHLRDKFASLAIGEANNFNFSCLGVPQNPDNIWWEFTPYSSSYDAVLWANPAPNYEHAAFFIDAGAEHPANNNFADKGAIFITQASNCCWVGTTVYTPQSGHQPFSGHRQWGITTLPNGNKAFYTKAADRALTAGLVRLAGNISPFHWNCDDDTYYDIAKKTWQNMMKATGLEIKAGGGQVPSDAHGNPVFFHEINRVDYKVLKSKLLSNTPVLFVSCGQ